jgi:hypothetical protein
MLRTQSRPRASTPRGRQTPCCRTLPLCRRQMRRIADPQHHSSLRTTCFPIKLSVQHAAIFASSSTLATTPSLLNPYAPPLTRPASKQPSLSPYGPSLTDSPGCKSLRAVTYEKWGSRGFDFTNKMFNAPTPFPASLTLPFVCKSCVCHSYTIWGGGAQTQ